MAYKINRGGEHVVLPQGLAQVADVHKIRSEIQKNTPEFYELEPAEVIDVFLDESDFRYHDHEQHNTIPLVDDKGKVLWKYYGWIRARMSVSNKGASDTILIAPLDTNIKEYPHPSEHVIVATYYGKKYYTQKLNIHNHVNLNSVKGLSKMYDPWGPEDYNVKEFRGDIGIRQVQSYEGDITFNGRFGQSIRFGSNITELYDENEDLIPDSGKPHSPSIIIRAGQGDPSKLPKFKWNLEDDPFKPVREDINIDGSSIWMTTDQKVDIDFSNKLTPGLYTYSEKGPDGFGGNQIIINSDRLIFNAKKNAILMTSPTAIGLSANHEIGLEVPNDTGKVLLGDVHDLTQPALGGELTMDLIDKLLGYLITFANGISGAQGTCVDFTIPISDILPSSKGLVSSLKLLKTRMNEPKSKTVMVGHIRGPE